MTMATIRAYTTIEQSRKLAKILPLESADMHWTKDFDGSWFVDLAEYTAVKIPKYVCNVEEHLLPCWSLASLLDVLPYPQLSKDKLGSGKIGWMASVYPNNCRYDSCWHDNPIDACVDMIIKLNERKML